MSDNHLPMAWIGETGYPRLMYSFMHFHWLAARTCKIHIVSSSSSYIQVPMWQILYQKIWLVITHLLSMVDIYGFYYSASIPPLSGNSTLMIFDNHSSTMYMVWTWFTPASGTRVRTSPPVGASDRLKMEL